MSKQSSRKLENLLSNLPENVLIDRFEQHDHSIELFVSWSEPPLGQRFCTSCGSNRCVKKDSGALQTVRHLPVGLRGTLITFHKPRYRCLDCGKTFYLKPSWLVRDISITYPLLLDIYARLTSTTHSVTDIARDTFTSPSIIQNVIRHFEMPQPKTLPETLGIDEFHGKTGVYNPNKRRYDTEKYHCVITDAAGGFVLDILYKASYAELLPYFQSFPLHERQKVKFFCADMRSGFSKIARQCFPQAKICIDPFHVVKLLTEAVSTIRVVEWRRLRDQANTTFAKAETAKERGDLSHYRTLSAEAKQLSEVSALVKNSQRLLVTSPHNSDCYWNRCPEKRTERLSKLYAFSPDLKLAREALTAFYDILELSHFVLKRAALSDWLDRYEACLCPPIRQAAHSIRYHRKGIENAWRFHKSNSSTEGLNKKIKDVKRMAYGAHDFENFRKRALLACGGTTFLRDPYPIFAEKKSPSSATQKGASYETLY